MYKEKLRGENYREKATHECRAYISFNLLCVVKISFSEYFSPSPLYSNLIFLNASLEYLNNSDTQIFNKLDSSAARFSETTFRRGEVSSYNSQKRNRTKVHQTFVASILCGGNTKLLSTGKK